MLRLDRLLARRQRWFVGVWVVALLVATPFAVMQTKNLSGGGWEASSSESVEVRETLERDFPDVSSATLVVVLVPRDDARPGDLTTAIREVEREVEQVDGARVTAAGRRRALAMAERRPGRPTLLPLPVRDGEAAAIDLAAELRKQLDMPAEEPAQAADGRVDVHVAGQGGMWAAFQEVSKKDTQEGETRGFPVIALVLLLAFGSLAAAALPLGLGVAAVVVTGAIIYLLSLAFTMSVFVTSMASLIGIGVAVDYSLFVLARYREEIGRGRPPDQARAAALATSGVVVVFSGLTVIASLSAMFVIDSPALRSMALGPIIVVAMSVLAASTLLPVLVRVLGRRAYEPGRIGRLLARRRERRAAANPGRAGFWERWTARVMRRPILSVVLASGVLLALAAPALDLKVENKVTGQLAQVNETAEATRTAAEIVGPGALGAVLVVADFDRGAVRDRENQAALRRVTAAIERDPAVGRVGQPRTSEDRRKAQLTVLLKSDPEAEASRDAISRLRTSVDEAAGDAATVQVGGAPAYFKDFDDLVSGSLVWIIVVVLGLSFVVLVVLLRSIVLPLKAVLMNILSVGAAYGVLVMAFQWGWLEWIGLDATDTVHTITPPLVLVVAFGLSMDYEVFLLSRIRERYTATGDTGRAVAEALSSSAATITSAALIMVAVFISFVSAGLPNLQQLGLASAVAIAVDATIVRLVLVPAAMKLLGDWNWWLPRPLARILPTTNVEELGDDVLPVTPAAATAANGNGRVAQDREPVG